MPKTRELRDQRSSARGRLAHRTDRRAPHRCPAGANRWRYAPGLEEHARATAHVECRKDEGVIDETPGAYKDIDAVMAAQADLVEIVHTLRQVV
jgi:RNA-splicing ligase RtcB